MTDKAAVNQRSGRVLRRKDTSRGLFYYAFILSVLVMLITAAFFTPQILFQLQDAILCGDTVLTQQESMNVEALSTTYEQSLQVRMLNYAEELAAGNTFYVASQNLTVTDEMREFIYSEKGIYGWARLSQTLGTSEFIHGNVMSGLTEMRLLPEFIWELEYIIEDWKQYVIYSDDFAKGVNFILWYVEMRDENGVVLKLLVDAEDSTIYAVRTEGNGFGISTDTDKEGGWNYIEDYFWCDEVATYVWGNCAVNYKALNDDEMKGFEIMVGEYGWAGDGLINGGAVGNHEEDGIVLDDEYIEKRQKEMEAVISFHEEWQGIQEKVRYYMWGGNAMYFLLPYGDASLDVVLETLSSEDAYMYGCPDFTMGIHQIYELIPEFA